VRRSETAAFYRHYLATVNAHAFDRLTAFVAEGVQINDEPRGLTGYAEGLRSVVRAFPDHHWELRSLVIDGDSIAAHLTGTGTHRGDFLRRAATGRRVTIPEFAIYHLDGDRIARVWGTVDHPAVLAQLS
jgi:predicted ester cyclase